MLKATTIRVSKMTIHYVGTVLMSQESESEIKK